MKKQVYAAAALIIMGIMAGCAGGNGSTPATTGTSNTKISGKAADGYLVNATVFLDKNGNYQLDSGEPSTVTDQDGAYTLDIATDDVGKYPIIVVAMKGQTIDKDTGTTVSNTYFMSLPALSVSGTVSGFVSPMSTLVREKMEANPGMSVADAMTQLRAQMNLPAGVNMMADYVSLSSSGSTDPDKGNYQLMHTAAQNMASLMAGQAQQVVATSGGTTTVDVNRFRAMMGSINQQLPQMVAAMQDGAQQGMMSQIAANVGMMVNSTAPSASGMGFRNMSSLFPNMSNIRFWNMSGHLVQGMMGGTSTSGATGGMMSGSTSNVTTGMMNSSTSSTGGTTGGATTTGAGTGMMGSSAGIGSGMMSR